MAGEEKNGDYKSKKFSGFLFLFFRINEMTDYGIKRALEASGKGYGGLGHCTYRHLVDEKFSSVGTEYTALT
jgi:hypothetical protein